MLARSDFTAKGNQYLAELSKATNASCLSVEHNDFVWERHIEKEKGRFQEQNPHYTWKTLKSKTYSLYKYKWANIYSVFQLEM